MDEIQDRYFHYNAHARSYTWKYNNGNLDMSKILAENKVTDERKEFYKLGIDEDQFLPAICILRMNLLRLEQRQKCVK